MKHTRLFILALTLLVATPLQAQMSDMADEANETSQLIDLKTPELQVQTLHATSLQKPQNFETSEPQVQTLCATSLQRTPKPQSRNRHAEPRMSGLYLNIDAGLLIPNSKQAAFYDGRPERPNRLDRVLCSQAYGTEIWNNLVSSQLISPSAIPDYSAFRVEEYAHMYYRLTYQLGVGFRYVYDNGWGWLLRFDYSQLTAAGQFQLSSNNGTGILGSNQYVTCDIFGVEKRMLIDFAITKRIPLTQTLDFELGLGFDVNNPKVTENAIRVAGKTYSILDVWGGQSPYPGIGTYTYISQGLIGIGTFASATISYLIRGTSIDFGYNCYLMQTKFDNFNENDCYALQHNIFLRFNINNFHFLD